MSESVEATEAPPSAFDHLPEAIRPGCVPRLAAASVTSSPETDVIDMRPVFNVLMVSGLMPTADVLALAKKWVLRWVNKWRLACRDAKYATDATDANLSGSRCLVDSKMLARVVETERCLDDDVKALVAWYQALERHYDFGR